MLNERIRLLRMEKGISQIQLADALGVTKQSISNWENDNIQPSIEMLVKLSKFFDVSTDYLLGLEKKRTLSVKNLTDKQISHIQLIIDDFKNLNS